MVQILAGKEWLPGDYTAYQMRMKYIKKKM